MKQYRYLAIFLSWPIFGGELLINSNVISNPENYALVIETKNTSLTFGSNSFSLSFSSFASLTIRYLTVKPGQIWQTFQIKASNIRYRLQSSEGELILENTILGGTQSFSIAEHKAAKSGKMLVLILSPTSPANSVKEVVLTYSGGGNLLAYPNPWEVVKGPLRIDYDLESDAEVRLEIYDATGRLVKTIKNGELYPAKAHSKESDFWDGRSKDGMALPSGVYYIRLQVRYLKTEFPSYEKSFKVVLIR